MGTALHDVWHALAPWHWSNHSLLFLICVLLFCLWMSNTEIPQ